MPGGRRFPWFPTRRSVAAGSAGTPSRPSPVQASRAEHLVEVAEELVGDPLVHASGRRVVARPAGADVRDLHLVAVVAEVSRICGVNCQSTLGPALFSVRLARAGRG